LNGFVPLRFRRFPESGMLERAAAFHELMAARRTTRHFSPEPVPRALIELAVSTAGTAPSGAHQQPWTFVVVDDPALKAKIREAAEEEERINYGGRMPPEWVEVLRPLGTDAVKAHLTDAPYLVVLFEQRYGVRPDGGRRTHYYVQESCGIAAGLFIAAVHAMGLVTLTHTPSPMGFLGRILGRPESERAYLVMPVGYPASAAQVPDLERKPLAEIMIWNTGERGADGGPQAVSES
jgi:iodotyrosine deiodinase